jgi:ATP-dependent RNA helicase DeaD
MADTPATFADFDLPPALLAVLNEVGYENPTPIQAAAIPVLMAGQDLIGQAQTGTGKTAAFALPLLARLDFTQREPQVLVLTPTRELAIQVAEAFQSYARHLPGFHVLPIYGGQSMGQQLRSLQRAVHVIVGTPGRVMDHLRRESLGLSKLRALVLDEADEMLRMGFLEEVNWILEHTPATRQTALFSATMPEQIRTVAQQHLKQAVELRIKSKTSTVEAIRQRYWQVAGLHKLDALTRILEVEDIDAALIFVRTKIATLELAEKLEARGYACAALNGDLNQAQREKTIEQLKNKQLDIVIATDVAARGLDVPRISHVINYDIPYDIEGYIHRIGRTGRAGRTGEAILFVAPREIRMLRAIERATRQPIEPMRAPSREAIADRRVAQFKQTVFDALASEDLEFFGGVIDEMAHERGVEPRELGAALAFLVQRERPLRVEGPGYDAPPARAEFTPTPREHRAREPRRAGGDETPRARAQTAAPIRRESPSARPRELLPARSPESAPPRVASPALETQALALKEHPEIEMVRYRIDIGHAQGATPKHIVGAIANEAGMESRYIGRIDIFDDFSTVDLPSGMPREVLQHLRKVRLGKFRFNLAPLSEPQLKGLAELSAEGARQLRGSPKPRKKRPS